MESWEGEFGCLESGDLFRRFCQSTLPGQDVRALFLSPANRYCTDRPAIGRCGPALALLRLFPIRIAFALRPILTLPLLILLPAGLASAQYPGQLAGRVTDAISGLPVENVWVEVLETDLTAVSDGLGEFRIAGLEPGRHRVRVSRLGYETIVRQVEIHNGKTARLALPLAVRPISVDAIRAEAIAPHGQPGEPGVIFISRETIESSGAHTAAELLDGYAGLIVQPRGPVGAQTISIRGSSADQVLVLLDGAPLNNPLTGEADLSTVPAAGIESITVLKGSHSARFGAGAQAGTVLIESRVESPPFTAGIETGSLGTWAAGTEAAGGSQLRWAAGAHVRTVDGNFTFRQPDVLGGGMTARTNSSLKETSAHTALSGVVGANTLRVRASYAQLDRGIPGTSFLPTPTATEDLTRWNAQAGWERLFPTTRLTAHAHALWQRNTFADPGPPIGPAYDSRSDGSAWGGRISGEFSGAGLVRSLAAGLELNQLSVESTELDPSSVQARFDYGVFVSGRFAPFGAAPAPRLIAALRLDRDDLGRAWWVSHELTVSAGRGPASFHLKHASSFRPPSFGDQFFREGVQVAANPELRAERVPAELSLATVLRGRLTGWADARLSIEAYTADVRDMIIWAPDFRFVWSPRNFDVRRRGLDLEAEVTLPRHSLTISAGYGLARIVYDRPGPDTVQVMYRPRHSAGMSASWSPANWDLSVGANYVGKRYPVPAPLNALDPYWTIGLRMRHRFAAGAWQLVPSLSVDRLFDNEDSLIFGYPEPGRIIRLAIEAQPR